MKPRVYYNEIDEFAAAWLRELMKAGQIPDGEVDTRSIADVQPDDLRGFSQCHFFAGIGGWAYALRLAGWPDDREVWTGSCPCQPFSAAGKGAGADDSRDLWPTWFRLIVERRPVCVFGEQVASLDGLGWLDRVSTNLETAGYAIGAVDYCAAGVAAPHIRQRLWFVADSERGAAERYRFAMETTSSPDQGSAQERQRVRDDARNGGDAGRRVGDADDAGSQGRVFGWERADQRSSWAPGLVDWVWCRDGKFRPVEPGTFPLADGIPARVGRIRGYGNAIVPQVAQVFIEAYLDSLEAV